MGPPTGLWSESYVQEVLVLICVSLLGIFAVKLYNARVRFINLKKQGLVGHTSQLGFFTGKVADGVLTI